MATKSKVPVANLREKLLNARLKAKVVAPKPTRVRMAPDARKGQLDAIVLDIFRTKSYMALTRRAVAEVAEVSESLPTNYYGTAAAMRKEALRLACTACTPADVKAVQRALETGEIKRGDLGKKMLQALK